MKEWVIYYNCPNCKTPCNGADDGMEEANEMVEAKTKTEAIRFFNSHKPCRHMRVTRIVEYKTMRSFQIAKA